LEESALARAARSRAVVALRCDFFTSIAGRSA
jgi:hypothetical protein